MYRSQYDDVNPVPSKKILDVVLEKIAKDHDVAVERVFVHDEIVFFTREDGMLRCACSIGTPYWIQLLAEAAAGDLIERLCGGALNVGTERK